MFPPEEASPLPRVWVSHGQEPCTHFELMAPWVWSWVWLCTAGSGGLTVDVKPPKEILSCAPRDMPKDVRKQTAGVGIQVRQ